MRPPTIEELLATADEMLYEAKQGKRNRAYELEPAKVGRAPNTLYLCGIGGALGSPEAAMIRELLA